MIAWYWPVRMRWNADSDPSSGVRPIYIGEGITGTRIHDSYHSREDWNYAQVLYDERFNDKTNGTKWRLLLERFAMLVLDPMENVR